MKEHNELILGCITTPVAGRKILKSKTVKKTAAKDISIGKMQKNMWKIYPKI